MRKRFLAVIVFMLMASPCYAMEYTIEAPANSLFGQPTSVETVAVTVEEPLNADRSKNVAMIPPAFGTATADLPGSGIYLTPNLVNEKESWHGPGAWRSTGINWSYEYVLRKTGILKAPVIRM